MLVADYAAKFEDLIRFCPYYNGVKYEESKCIKFENGLRPKIKQFIEYEEISQLPVLVNKCCIYDEDNRARSVYYKMLLIRRMVTRIAESLILFHMVRVNRNFSIRIIMGRVKEGR